MPTLKKEVKLSGRGIHSGERVDIVVKPSDKKGIYFIRTDIKDSRPIVARYDNVGETRMRNTTIGDVGAAHVQTVEHLMAAFLVAGIDSAIVDITGPETPILDGSAAQFYDAFMAAGVTAGAVARIIVRRPVVAHAREILRTLPLMTRVKLWFFNTLAGRKSDGYVKLMPNDGAGLRINATLVYPEKIIGRQQYEYLYDGTKKTATIFASDIARARTFGKFSEWEYLKARGMGRGADATNVIALNDKGDGTLNSVIWPDEFVRHKIIDALGDMATSGGLIIGDLVSYKGSHAMNNLVLKKLFSDSNNYDIIKEK